MSVYNKYVIANVVRMAFLSVALRVSAKTPRTVPKNNQNRPGHKQKPRTPRRYESEGRSSRKDTRGGRSRSRTYSSQQQKVGARVNPLGNLRQKTGDGWTGRSSDGSKNNCSAIGNAGSKREGMIKRAVARGRKGVSDKRRRKWRVSRRKREVEEPLGVDGITGT